MAEGHYVAYKPRDFRPETLKLIQTCNAIIEEYEGKGMPMSLRQLYYQMVARGLLENNDGNYNRIGDVINNGRMAGLVSWTAIEDRGRNLRGYMTFNGPELAVKWLHDEQYRIDMWADQSFRPEVWVEKRALEGVIGAICSELRVDFFAIGGYNSQSEQWRAGRRFANYLGKGQRPIVFHLGDHDPSGMDMTRDNQERLSLFAGTPIQVVRIALNMDQVEKYKPPPNPAKDTDVRYGPYAALYGDESWEVDALPPDVIHDIIRDAIVAIRDEKKWDAALSQEVEDKLVLTHMIEESGDDGEA